MRVPRIKTLSIKLLLAATFFVACLPNDAARAAETAADLTVSEKAYVGSRIYSSIEMYFAHWEAIPELDLNKAYKDYLERALAAKDRREFDLDTFEFVAKLHNAHSSFWDEWLGKEYGQPVGFEVCVLQGKWVIWRTQLPDVKIGDVINGIDGEPIESFFQSHKKYVNASSESAARNGLFYMPYLFPENFTITLEGGRQARVDREHQKLTPQAPSKTEGRTMASGAVGYMRIPSFDDPAFEEEALNVIKSFSGAGAIVVDVRHNGGGNTPTKLLTALMNKPFREWTESTPIQIGLVNVQLDPNAHATYRIPSVLEQPDGSAYAGKLILLVDGGCGSACEDFVAPFKDNHRATIVGTETLGSTGQPYYLRFENGMSFRVSTKREFFPDGSQFEGVGIKPDVQLEPSADDLRNGKDPVLEKALELAQEATSPSQ